MSRIVIIAFFLSVISARAQSVNNVEDHQVQIGLPMPAILYEKGVGKNSTLSIEAVAGLWIRDCTRCNTEFGVYPILRGQYRYYYNMKRRLDKKKNISGNSGNYVGGLILYQDGNALLGSLNTVSTVAVGPVYGIQRTYKKGFFYRLETGLAYFEDDSFIDNNGITLVLAARIGWTLGHKKK
ncbi:hypothetical protein [Maribacter sp. 2210JD10-5]|uniref:hypothetical protein n=1 Tax=Maribacter sp. 2210JD10-5 TaxID=3386272 RepID=UPI0039BD1FF7